MTYTKGTFQMVADIIKRQKDALGGESQTPAHAMLETLALDAARVFRASNPAFRTSQFMTACGFGGDDGA